MIAGRRCMYKTVESLNRATSLDGPYFRKVIMNISYAISHRIQFCRYLGESIVGRQIAIHTMGKSRSLSPRFRAELQDLSKGSSLTLTLRIEDWNKIDTFEGPELPGARPWTPRYYRCDGTFFNGRWPIFTPKLRRRDHPRKPPLRRPHIADINR